MKYQQKNMSEWNVEVIKRKYKSKMLNKLILDYLLCSWKKSYYIQLFLLSHKKCVECCVVKWTLNS